MDASSRWLATSSVVLFCGGVSGCEYETDVCVPDEWFELEIENVTVDGEPATDLDRWQPSDGVYWIERFSVDTVRFEKADGLGSTTTKGLTTWSASITFSEQFVNEDLVGQRRCHATDPFLSGSYLSNGPSEPDDVRRMGGREGPKTLDLDRDAGTVRITWESEPIVESWLVGHAIAAADD